LLHMNRAIVLILAATAASAVFAAAAGLTLASARLGAGGTAVSTCDSDGFTFQNTLDLSGAVTSVTVSGINAACAGGSLNLTLANFSGASIGSGSASLPASGFTGSVTVSISPQPQPNQVSRYVATVTGP
jgi:hypothetical protein